MRAARWLVLGCVVLTAALLAYYFWPARALSQSETRPWIVRRSEGGLVLSWNRKIDPLRNARRVDLILRRTGMKEQLHELAAESGTLFIPGTSEQLGLALRLEGGGQAARVLDLAETPDAGGPIVANAHNQRARVLMQIVRPGRPTPLPIESSVQLVLPVAEPDLFRGEQRSIDIELFVKVDPTGHVTSATSRYYDDGDRKKLAGEAANALLKAVFEPLDNAQKPPIYRDAKLTLRFTAAGTALVDNVR